MLAFGSVADLDRAARKNRNILAAVGSLVVIGMLVVVGALAAPSLLGGGSTGDSPAKTATLNGTATADAQAQADADAQADAQAQAEAQAQADADAQTQADADAQAEAQAQADADAQAQADADAQAEAQAQADADAQTQADAQAQADAQEEALTVAEGVPTAADERFDPIAWVCDGNVRIEDPKGRRWSVNKVEFLPRDGYERVVLYLRRTGPSGGALAAVSAQAFDTAAIRSYVAGAAKPSAGGSTVGVHLVDGIGADIGLRRYRPEGLRTVTELSMYPAARSSSKMLITSVGDGCFRLRVAAWESGGDEPLDKAQILIDVRR